MDSAGSGRVCGWDEFVSVCGIVTNQCCGSNGAIWEGYGRKIALIGGIDVDFLCRSDEKAIRKRVRETLDVCQPGSGYCLGTGNSVCNYIPVDNYLTIVDEGRLYGG